MDVMNITSSFTTGIISKILKKAIKSKVGYNVNLDIKKINIQINNGLCNLSMEVNAEMTTSELMKIVKI